MFGKTSRGAARDEARNDKLEEEGRGGKRGRGGSPSISHAVDPQMGFGG